MFSSYSSNCIKNKKESVEMDRHYFSSLSAANRTASYSLKKLSCYTKICFSSCRILLFLYYDLAVFLSLVLELFKTAKLLDSQF